MWWYNFLDLLAYHQSFIELILLILWTIYIIFSVRTFREVKRQTELLSEAYLLITSELVPLDESNYDDDDVPSTAIDLFIKWYRILLTSIPMALTATNYVVLTLHNRGKSDIVWWKINIRASVRPETYLSKNYNSTGDYETWTVEYENRRDIIAPGNEIEIVIGRHLLLQWPLNWRDVQ